MDKKYRTIKITILSLKSILQVEPSLFLISIFISLLHSLSWGISILMKQFLFDNATAYVEGIGKFQTLICSIIFLGVISVLSQVFNGMDVFLYNLITNRVKGKLSIKIHKKLHDIAPINFENSDRLEKINIVEEGKNNCIAYALILKDIMSFYLPYFIFMGFYLFNLKPILVFSLIVVFLPTIISRTIRIKMFEKLVDESAPYKRQSEYYEKCIVDLEYFKETRILGIKNYFLNKWSESFVYMQNLKFAVTSKAKFVEFLLQMLTVFGYVIILVGIFISLLNDEISIGAFVAVFSTIASMYGIMKSVVCYRVGDMAQNVGSIRNYFRFMDWDEEGGRSQDFKEIEDIELRNVSFQYPKTNAPSIKNISLTIKKGETIALVGENGSGKSTLVKLIAGLFSPSSGEIMINGKNAKIYHPSVIRHHFSAVFQKYQRYQMTVKSNIIISDPYHNYVEEKLSIASKQAGFDIYDSKFISGIETVLSRSFGSLDISGGEWQRLAIARCFFRCSDFVILDEPTAAIDPFEEKMIYDRFASLVKDKTAFIVTHRLASAKMADRIIVLNQGEICEVGTHAELMQHQGIYCGLYESQKQWYKK